MADAEDVCVGFGAVGDLGEGGDSVAARELEDVGRVSDDVDVDVSAFQRVHARAGVDRVLILVDLDDPVALVRPVHVSAQVVQVQPVRLPALAGHDTDTRDVAAGELAGQDLKGARSEILVGAVEGPFLPRHEEVDDGQAAVVVDGHVHGGLLEGRRGLAAVDGDVGELRGVSVARGKEDGSAIVGSKASSGHPDAAALGGIRDSGALGGESLDGGSRGLVPAHDPAGEVVLDTVGCEAGVDELARVQEGGPLVVDAAVEAAGGVVPGNGALEIDREVRSLAQVVDVEGVEIVAAVGLTLGASASGLVGIGLGRVVQRIGFWVDDAGRGDADERVDVDASVEVGGQEGDVQVPGGDDLARLRVQLVHVVLGGRKVDVLHAIRRRVDQGLGEDLLRSAVVVPGQLGLEDLGKLITRHDRRVHVMIPAGIVSIDRFPHTAIVSVIVCSRLIASSGVVTAPGDGVCRGQTADKADCRGQHQHQCRHFGHDDDVEADKV